MVQEFHELCLLNKLITIIVEGFEGLADGAPLGLDLVDEFFYRVTIVSEVGSSSSPI